MAQLDGARCIQPCSSLKWLARASCKLDRVARVNVCSHRHEASTLALYRERNSSPGVSKWRTSYSHGGDEREGHLFFYESVAERIGVTKGDDRPFCTDELDFVMASARMCALIDDPGICKWQKHTLCMPARLRHSSFCAPSHGRVLKHQAHQRIATPRVHIGSMAAGALRA